MQEKNSLEIDLNYKLKTLQQRLDQEITEHRMTRAQLADKYESIEEAKSAAMTGRCTLRAGFVISLAWMSVLIGLFPETFGCSPNLSRVTICLSLGSTVVEQKVSEETVARMRAESRVVEVEKQCSMMEFDLKQSVQKIEQLMKQKERLEDEVGAAVCVRWRPLIGFYGYMHGRPFLRRLRTCGCSSSRRPARGCRSRVS